MEPTFVTIGYQDSKGIACLPTIVWLCCLWVYFAEKDGKLEGARMSRAVLMILNVVKCFVSLGVSNAHFHALYVDVTMTKF